MKMTIALALVGLSLTVQQVSSRQDYWVSLFHRMAVAQYNDATWQEYDVTVHRRGQEDAAAARTEITELVDVYDQHPESRVAIGVFLHSVAYERLMTFGGATDAFVTPLQPIVPTLVAHLFDGDARDR